MRVLVVVFSVLTFCGCAVVTTSSSPVLVSKPALSEDRIQNWKWMIGRWYGSQPIDGGGVRQQLTERNGDGTYRITMRYVDANGKLKEGVEVGQWGIVGPVYFSIFRGWVKNGMFTPSSPSEPYNYDAYEVLLLTDDRFQYKSYSTGSIYTLEKVSEKFVLPDLL